MEINKLLRPKKICIVGASEKTGFGGDTCRNTIEYMQPEDVFFVNPKRDEVLGKKCYASMQEVPENFDLVVICTPKSTVELLLRQAKEKGAGAAVVFASGYAEDGTAEGKQAQAQLLQTCKELDIALMGPNCAGFVNYTDMKYPFAFLAQNRDRKGSVGVISQSGQICLSLMESPNMCFSYVISAGNSAVIQMEDYMEFLIEDSSTKVVSLYLEGVKNAPKFIDCLRRAALLRKPIVILKAGRSEKGSKIAASHTGSLSGADKVFDAVFRRFGVIRVDDIEELLAASLMFSTLSALPAQPTVASMNLSGGETGVCADVGNAWGIAYPDFSPETLRQLKQQLPSYASPANPLDMTATLSYDAQAYAQALRTVMQDSAIGIVAVGYTLLEEITDTAICYMTQAIEQVAAEKNAKPMVMVPFVENTRNAEYAARLAKAGVPVLPPTVYAFKLLRYLCDFAAYRAEEHQLKLALPQQTGMSQIRQRTAMTEHQSKQVLAQVGIATPREEVALTMQQAEEIADTIGYPVVMKIDSVDIMHKSDAGCVKINVTDRASVRSVYSTILANAKSYAPEAKIGGVLVQEMLEKGMEMIIGVNNDAQFGPVVMCGLGGVFVEIFKDVALCPAPVNFSEAQQMLRSLKAYPLLCGYRGGASLDVDAVAQLIVDVSKLAAAQKDTLLELDINPVFVYEKGISVADALLIESR